MEQRFHEDDRLYIPMYIGALQGAEAIDAAEEVHRDQHFEVYRHNELSVKNQILDQ